MAEEGRQAADEAATDARPVAPASEDQAPSEEEATSPDRSGVADEDPLSAHPT